MSSGTRSRPRAGESSPAPTGLNKLAGSEPYDLLITDTDLPHVTGLAVVSYARSLPHRRQTPIIMFTASECREEAREAGVDAYLRKPDDLEKLVETVAMLTGQGGATRPEHARR
jgi:CheY-like chemotaxis protein